MELLAGFKPLDQETVGVDQGCCRILFEDIDSPEDLPPFSRSTMDGYAVRARDTFGCSESEPALLKIAGEIAMGSLGSEVKLAPGHAARIWTGGALPAGADSVVMVEYTHQIDDHTIEVFRPVAPAENVIAQGEDFSRGHKVLARGHELRPQDLGVLAGLGLTRIPVFRRPKVAVISTGDELVPPESRPGPGKIRDINSTTLAALANQAGGIGKPMGIVKDDPGSLQMACEDALEKGADIVLLSGGSSVGCRDYTLRVFESLSGAELLAHGISLRPGKPTILAKRGNTALFGLPGHVASAIVVFCLFVRPLIRLMSGRALTVGMKEIKAVCRQEIPSVSGREDFVRVKVEKKPGPDLPEAVPIWGRSGLLRPLVEADGLLVIPRDSEGLEKGEPARVLLF